MASIRVVDIGGNGMRRADVCGTEVRNLETVLPKASIDEVLAFASGDLAEDNAGIAYAVAGVIRDQDMVVSAPNVPAIHGQPLASKTREYSGKESVVLNDMEAAVTGMAACLPDDPYFLGITWSSGIGVRLSKNNELVSVAEAGHMVLDPSPFAPLCGCGKRGHVEGIVGGDAIRRQVEQLARIHGVDLQDKHPSKVLDESFVRGDQWAVDLYHTISHGMGLFLANLVSVTQVPLIVWKGSFAKNALFNEAGPKIEPLIRRTMQDALIDPTWASEENLRFLFTPGAAIDGFHDNDAFIGAAAALSSR